MSKAEMIRRIEDKGIYCKVRIDAGGMITGMLVNEDHRYDPFTNTGGRRFIGHMSEMIHEYA